MLYYPENDKLRPRLTSVINQLICIAEETQKAAGVTITKLPGGRLKLVDGRGNVVIRPANPWEVY